MNSHKLGLEPGTGKDLDIDFTVKYLGYVCLISIVVMVFIAIVT